MWTVGFALNIVHCVDIGTNGQDNYTQILGSLTLHSLHMAPWYNIHESVMDLLCVVFPSLLAFPVVVTVVHYSTCQNLNIYLIIFCYPFIHLPFFLFVSLALCLHLPLSV